MERIVEIENLSKKFIDNGNEIHVLHNINFSLDQGKSLAILGPSGCGKTTLLQILGLLDSDFEGKYKFCGRDVSSLKENEKNSILTHEIAFVHQFHHLFPEFSALENVAIPKMNAGFSKKDAQKEAALVLSKLGLADKQNANPWQLSGGERQRVAMARAIINSPKLLLADEPTGNLDPENSEIAMSVLQNLCKDFKTSLIFVTHNHDLAKRCDGIIRL